MQEIAQLGERLRSIYEQAFAAKQHGIAYHALAALMHAGEALRDPDLVAEVETRAKDQLKWLDLNDPRHTHASLRAAARGHPSIFAQLAATAAAARTRLKAEEVQRRQEQKRRPKAPSSQQA